MDIRLSSQHLNRSPILLKILADLPITIIEARMKQGADEMRDDFEVQEIRIEEPEKSNEQGFGTVVCEYIYEEAE